LPRPPSTWNTTYFSMDVTLFYINIYKYSKKLGNVSDSYLFCINTILAADEVMLETSILLTVNEPVNMGLCITIVVFYINIIFILLSIQWNLTMQLSCEWTLRLHSKMHRHMLCIRMANKLQQHHAWEHNYHIQYDQFLNNFHIL